MADNGCFILIFKPAIAKIAGFESQLWFCLGFDLGFLLSAGILQFSCGISENSAFAKADFSSILGKKQAICNQTEEIPAFMQ